MDALLAALQVELERGVRVRRRLTIALLIGATALGTAGVLWTTVRGDRSQPAGANPQAATWELTLSTLTKTSGSGVSYVAMDPTGSQLAYASKGVLWIREASGGIPRRRELPFEPTGQFAFGEQGDVLWMTGASALWRVASRGDVSERIAENVGPAEFLVESSGGEIAGLSASQLWRVNPRIGGPTRVRSRAHSEHLTGLAWSPDGTQLAVRSWPTGAAFEMLRISTRKTISCSRLKSNFRGTKGWPGFTKTASSRSGAIVRASWRDALPSTRRTELSAARWDARGRYRSSPP
jgi:hypothetical protein